MTAGFVIVGVFALMVHMLLAQTKQDLQGIAIALTERWVTPAVGQRDVIMGILRGDAVSPAAERRLNFAAQVSGILSYRIVGADGWVRRTTKSSPGPRITRFTGDYANYEREVVASGKPVAVVDGHTELIHSHHSDKVQATVFHPITVGDEVIAVVSAEVDLTAQHDAAADQFMTELVLLLILTVLAVSHNVASAVLIVRERRVAARINHLALHDSLTGAPNRAAFAEQLSKTLAGAEQNGTLSAMHIIDLDRFKMVNDTMGHDAGDALLVNVAGALKQQSKTNDVFARLGGDEFVFLQRGAESREEVARRSEALAEGVRAITSLNGTPVNASASVGAATTADSTNAEELQRFADAALYHAKELGRDCAVVFEPGMDAGIRQRNELRALLRKALSGSTFELFYQPLHCAEDGSLNGFEALLRLPDGTGGFVSPTVFIPIAEEMQITPAIGAWVLEQACRAAQEWPSHISVSVNLSPQQFEHDIVDVVKTALEESGLAPNRLNVEITENLFISKPAEVAQILAELRDIGVQIVMDDFGTGYSSLQHLWRFPFDKLKVDRSCFQSLGESQGVSEILRTISAMSDAMNLAVTAEGIETEAQKAFACSAGYNELQGFLYSRPMPYASVTEYIENISAEADAANGRPGSPTLVAPVAA
ncbi:MAG: EAL domain-containing protein [Pseudomonadota bacterium]